MTIREAAEQLTKIEFRDSPPEPSAEWSELSRRITPNYEEGVGVVENRASDSDISEAVKQLIGPGMDEEVEFAQEMINRLDERARAEIQRGPESPYYGAAETWEQAGLARIAVALQIATEWVMNLDLEWMELDEEMSAQQPRLIEGTVGGGHIERFRCPHCSTEVDITFKSDLSELLDDPSGCRALWQGLCPECSDVVYSIQDEGTSEWHGSTQTLPLTED